MRPLVSPIVALEAGHPGPSVCTPQRNVVLVKPERKSAIPRSYKIACLPAGNVQDEVQLYTRANSTPLIPRTDEPSAAQPYDDGHHLPPLPDSRVITVNEEYLFVQLRSLAELQVEHSECFQECIPGRCIMEDPHVRWFLQQPLFEDPNQVGPSERPPSFNALQLASRASRAVSRGVAAVEPRLAKPIVNRAKPVLRMIKPVTAVEDYVVPVRGPAPVINVDVSAFDPCECDHGANKPIVTSRKPIHGNDKRDTSTILRGINAVKPGPVFDNLRTPVLAPNTRNVPVPPPDALAQHAPDIQRVIDPVMYSRFVRTVQDAMRKQTAPPPRAPPSRTPVIKNLPPKRARGNVLVLGSRVDSPALRVPPHAIKLTTLPQPAAAAGPGPPKLIPIVPHTLLHNVPSTRERSQRAPVGLSPIPAQQLTPTEHDLHDPMIFEMDQLAVKEPPQFADLVRVNTHLDTKETRKSGERPIRTTVGWMGRKSLRTTVFSSDGDDEASGLDSNGRRSRGVVA